MSEGDGMTPAPERPDPEAVRAQDEWDASLPHENGLLQTAPERPDPIPPYHDDRGDLQEAWVRGYHAAEAAAPVTDAGLDVERLAHAYNNVVVLTGTGKGWTTETWGKVAAEYAALSRQVEKG